LPERVAVTPLLEQPDERFTVAVGDREVVVHDDAVAWFATAPHDCAGPAVWNPES
jgi:hypothetical protein